MCSKNLSIVMPALVAPTSFLRHLSKQDVDGRDKPGHDSNWKLFAGLFCLRRLWASARSDLLGLRDLRFHGRERVLERSDFTGRRRGLLLQRSYFAIAAESFC